MKSNRYKILVVEDEPNINEFVCTLLEVGGYQVVSALSGGSAMLLSIHIDRILSFLTLDFRIWMGLMC